MSQSVETHGSPPLADGRRCDALICEQFISDGVVLSTASVTFVALEGLWYRLAVDYPAVFWRTLVERPQPWAVVEKGWEYPHVDVGAIARVVGLHLREIETSSDNVRTQVALLFEGGRCVVIEGSRQSSHYAVT